MKQVTSMTTGVGAHLCGPSTGDWVDLLLGLAPPVLELFSAGRPAGVVELDGLPALGIEEVAVAMGEVVRSFGTGIGEHLRCFGDSVAEGNLLRWRW